MTNYLKVARKIALRSPHPLFRHATLVFRGGALVAVGYNHDGLHAETVALEKLWPSKRQGCSILNIRLAKDGERLAQSKPCPKCAEYLRANGIRKVFFTDAAGELRRQ